MNSNNRTEGKGKALARVAFVAAFLSAVLYAGCLQAQQAPAPQAGIASPAPALELSPEPPANRSEGVVAVNVTVSAPQREYYSSKIVEAVKGASAFEVFSKAAVMGFKNYSFGIYVFSVDGINESGAEGLYWQYYFNGRLAPVGVSSFRVSQDGLLEWRLEKPPAGAGG